MNRRRLQFEGPDPGGSDGFTESGIGARSSSGEGTSSAARATPISSGGPSSRGVPSVTDELLHRGMRTPTRGVEVQREAASSSDGMAGRILMTPQQASASSSGTARRGMLTPLPAAIAEDVDDPEVELRFTHNLHLHSKGTSVCMFRTGNMSGHAFERELEGLDTLYKELQQIPPDIGPSARKKGKSPATVSDDTNLGSRGWQAGDDLSDREEEEIAAEKLQHVFAMQPRETHSSTRMDIEVQVGNIKPSRPIWSRSNPSSSTQPKVQQVSSADISREPPARAKPKGRKMTESEKQEAALGAKGPTLGTRKCSECNKYATHNARTCPTLPHNQRRLEDLRSRRGAGRPPGAVNRSKIALEADGSEGGSETVRKAREKVMPTSMYAGMDSWSEGHDEMDIDG